MASSSARCASKMKPSLLRSSARRRAVDAGWPSPPRMQPSSNSSEARLAARCAADRSHSPPTSVASPRKRSRSDLLEAAARCRTATSAATSPSSAARPAENASARCNASMSCKCWKRASPSSARASHNSRAWRASACPSSASSPTRKVARRRWATRSLRAQALHAERRRLNCQRSVAVWKRAPHCFCSRADECHSIKLLLCSAAECR
mmetsp:Transcript_50361/g.126852  ORF Transcript_50361/g.126852 Transcript_50361/m.126852 type:complete len:207 (-) Transcript_50361:1578-2198(-)